MSLSEGCDVTMHIHKLVSELLLFHDGKQLTINAYTDNQILHNVEHTLKQTLEKRLLVDMSAIRETVEKHKINLTWIEKTKQISDILTKAGISGVLSSSKMIEL